MAMRKSIKKLRKLPTVPICICGNIAGTLYKSQSICASCSWKIRHHEWDTPTIAIVYGLGSKEELAFAANEVFADFGERRR